MFPSKEHEMCLFIYFHVYIVVVIIIIIRSMTMFCARDGSKAVISSESQIVVSADCFHHHHDRHHHHHHHHHHHYHYHHRSKFIQYLTAESQVLHWSIWIDAVFHNPTNHVQWRKIRQRVNSGQYLPYGKIYLTFGICIYYSILIWLCHKCFVTHLK